MWVGAGVGIDHALLAWRFCLSRQRGGGYNTVLELVHTSGPPTAGAKSSYDAMSLERTGFGDHVGGSSLSFSQWQRPGGSSGTSRRQGGARTANTRFVPVQYSDYSTIGLPIDGPNGRWRFLNWGKAFAAPGSWTKNSDQAGQQQPNLECAPLPADWERVAHLRRRLGAVERRPGARPAQRAERARRNALYETCVLMMHNAVEPGGATPVYQELASPVIPLDGWVSHESVERMGVRLPPFRGG